MVLEAVMICCDNSDYMRNGDYAPTRLVAQAEAANLLADLKTQHNVESQVGVLTMAGNRIDLLMPPSRDMGKMMHVMNNIVPKGQCNFVAGIKTAHLALKNRTNKSQKQRIILFVGSPVDASEAELTALGKVLKKNSVAVDVINFGEENTTNDTQEKMLALIGAVNNQENSRLVNVPPGPHNLCDMVISTLMSDAGSAAIAAASARSGAAGGDFSAFGGIDPNADPELAMVLRMSMEEEQRRVREATAASMAATAPAPAPAAASADVDMDEDALLAQAIAMSMAAENEVATPQKADVEMSEVQSTTTPQPSAASAASSASGDLTAALRDPQFLDELLDSLPGVDKSEIDIDELLGSMNADESKKKEEKK